MKKASAKAGIFLLSFLLAGGAAAAAKLKTGGPAPEFILPDVNGGTRSLKDYKGRFVVLEWTNHNCPFVKKFYSAGHMQQLQERYTGRGAVWLAINSTHPKHRDFHSPDAAAIVWSRQKAKGTALLQDADGKTGRKYGAKTTPHMFVINPEGILIYQGAIDSIASADPADIPKARNHLAAALDEALAGKPVTRPAVKPYGCSVKYRP